MTKKTETTTKPTTTKKSETTTRSDAVTTTQAATVTTTGAEEESTTAVLPEDAGEAVSVIRPENSPTLFDFEEPGSTAEVETEPDEPGGSPAVWYVSGAALAALAVAAVLIKKKKA